MQRVENQLNKIRTVSNSRVTDLSVSSASKFLSVILDDISIDGHSVCIFNPGSSLLIAGTALLNPSFLLIVADRHLDQPMAALAQLNAPYNVLSGSTEMIRPHVFDIAIICPALARGEKLSKENFKKAAQAAKRVYGMVKQEDFSLLQGILPNIRRVGTVDVMHAVSSHHSKDSKPVQYDMVSYSTAGDK